MPSRMGWNSCRPIIMNARRSVGEKRCRFAFQRLGALDEHAQTFGESLNVEKTRHEVDLIERHLEKPLSELDERRPREIPSPVEIALARRIGPIHHRLVLAATL